MTNALRNAQYFFSDIRKEGIVLYELDDRELAEPGVLRPEQAFKAATDHLDQRFKTAVDFLEIAEFAFSRKRLNQAAFLLHQSVEQSYATLLLVLTNYSPPSHDLKFLRMLSEDRDRRLIDAWPREQQCFNALFNVLNEAYVKAR